MAEARSLPAVGELAHSRRRGWFRHYQRWEMGTDELSVIVGGRYPVRPKAIRGLRPAGSKSLEVTLEVVSEDYEADIEGG